MEQDPTMYFFDSGSRRNYVSKEIAKQLNLPAYKLSHIFKVKGFCGQESQKKKHPILQIGPKRVLFNITPSIHWTTLLKQLYIHNSQCHWAIIEIEDHLVTS